MPDYKIKGISSHIEKIKQQIKEVAPTGLSVLIQGPTGTGKELIAHNIHDKSKRKDKPFIALNCAAIPSELFESELFGYVKGSHSKASRDTTGKVELTEGGTLFLDEIADLSPQHQDKILRFLQEKEFYPVGGTEPIKSDARIIAATNQDLLECNTFRKDLYYRLNQFLIQTNDLSSRPEDIIFFVNKRLPQKKRRISNEEAKIKFLLYAHKYPGNIRELLNLLEIARSLKSESALEQIKLSVWRNMCDMCEEPLTSSPTNFFVQQDSKNEKESRIVPTSQSFSRESKLFREFKLISYAIKLINVDDKHILNRLAVYEQIVLLQGTKLSKKAISELLGIRKDTLSPANFRETHGFVLPDRNTQRIDLASLLYDYPKPPILIPPYAH